MRRLLAVLLAFLGFTGVVLVLPVYAEPGPEAEPVQTSAEEIPLGSVTEPAADAEVQAGTSEPVAGVPPTAPTLTVTKVDVSFSLVGVTWASDPAVTDVHVQVRVQDADDVWGEWTEVGPEDAEQDAGANDAVLVRGGTEPLWTGPSTGVEVELVTRSGAAPTDVQLDLVDPGASAADTSLGTPDIQDTADAAMAMPDVYSRAQWGADESIMTWAPHYAPTIRAATLHHTAGANNYTAGDVPAILRSIYRYHAVSRGWGDIGYNVLVDKTGRLWEGRVGGLASTVIGAHAGGFNSGTFGVSMLGNYDTAATTQPMVDAVAAIIAWKFSLYGVNPRGSTTLTSGGGGTSKYAAGVQVTLPTIFGHRDVGSTSCPGQYGYARLGEIRDRVAAQLSGADPIGSRYSSDADLRALLGAPVGTQQTTASVTWQAYTHGRLYFSPAAGVHYLLGQNLAKYVGAGGPNVFGAPTTDELAAPDRVGRFNHFSSGASIYWTSTTGSHVVRGAIRDSWSARGWERGPLGYPTTDENRTPTKPGAYNHFEQGSIYWSPTTGAWEVRGAIRAKWAELGWENSRLGFPTSDEYATADGRRSNFQNGFITWSAGTGAVVHYR